MTESNKTIGAIVADNYATSEVFARHGINYYSQGHRTLAEASREAGIAAETLCPS